MLGNVNNDYKLCITLYLIGVLSDAWIEVELLVEVPHLVETALLGATFRLVEAHLIAYLEVLDKM